MVPSGALRFAHPYPASSHMDEATEQAKTPFSKENAMEAVKNGEKLSLLRTWTTRAPRDETARTLHPEESSRLFPQSRQKAKGALHWNADSLNVELYSTELTNPPSKRTA